MSATQHLIVEWSFIGSNIIAGKKHTKAMVTWVVQIAYILTKSYGRGCELWLHWFVSKVQFARVAKYSGFMLVTVWVSGF